MPYDPRFPAIVIITYLGSDDIDIVLMLNGKRSAFRMLQHWPRVLTQLRQYLNEHPTAAVIVRCD